jgi:hypothetical protein
MTVTQEQETANCLLARNRVEIYTIDELIKRRASELQDSPLLAYPKEGLVDYEEHSASAIDRYVDAAAAALLQRGLKPVVRPIVGFPSFSKKACSYGPASCTYPIVPQMLDVLCAPAVQAGQSGFRGTIFLWAYEEARVF